MSKQNTQEETSTTATDIESVVEYLRLHPDFFEKQPELLAELNLSHSCGGAVSLIEHQVRALRNQNGGLKKQLDDLISIARENDVLNDRIHRLTLSLLDADTINDAYIALDDTLRGEFQCDAVSVKLFLDMDEVEPEDDNELMQTILVHMNDPSMSEYKSILTSDAPMCGPLKPEQIAYLFGDDSDDIKSTALVPLGGDRCSSVSCPFLGILAVGSHDPNRFHPKMGTLFLGNLGDIVSRVIRLHLIDKHTI